MDDCMTTALKQSRGKGFARFRIRKEKGMALIVSLLIVVLLTLLAVTGLRTSIVEEQISGNQKLAAKALFAAEQGVSEALEDLFNGTISDAGSETDTAWSAAGSAYGVGYSVDYTISHQLAGGAIVVNDDGRTYFQINSTGTSQLARRMLEVAIAVEMGGASNIAGLIGCQGVSAASNVVTSSYSSSGELSDGDRGDVATTDADAFMYMDGGSDFDVNGQVRSTGALYLGSDALVRRDALATLRITTESNAHVYGSATTNGNFDGSSGSVSGDINQGNTVVPDPIVQLEECDPWDIDSIFDNVVGIKNSNDNNELDNGELVDCSNGVCDYKPGDDADLGIDVAARDYYFSNFTLESGETVTVYGEVRLYISGNFTMKSNPELIIAPGASLKIYMESGRFWMDSVALANIGGLPINLQVFSKAENTMKDDKNWTDDEPDIWDDSQDIAGVKIDSNSVFYGMIYAPRAHVVLYSNAEIYGSVRGRFVTTDSNLAFNYDEDLDDLWVGLPTNYQLVYWTEQYPE
jgi:hypothetical protein